MKSIKQNLNSLKENTIWRTNDGTLFVITKINEEKDEPLIHYKSLFNQKTYSCLKKAFIERFSAIEN